MILLAYSLLDNKTGHFSTPFFFNHRGHAIRAVMELGADPNTTVGRHPADFTLCEIGIFDDQVGRFTSEECLYLGTVRSFIPVQPPQGTLFQSAETAVVPSMQEA